MQALLPPRSEAELLARAETLSGESFARVAERVGLVVPPDLRRHKGWVGNLAERALGASAGSRPQPDFEGLGVELKTLPVDPAGNPYESTFVCTIHPAELSDVEWDVSHVKRKLSRVLWLPIDGDRRRALGERRFGSPLLWSPDDDELSALRFDWEELAGLVARVGADLITAHVGRVLQIRPKARDSRARRRAFDVEGGTIAALPRGFYLRASFTGAILRRHFGLGA
ncbi:MAG TPA: DNA mismatch repair endonuclease MutH [Polyangiaceae bacterium]|nr:DNA mismatch repair endonuclease MutH [Polyangiaceae bacterium]